MIRVVIVDDEALVRSGLQLILGAVDDIEVVAAVDGTDAVQTTRRTTPAVVLLDIRMRGRNGLDVLRDLRQLQTPPIVAVLTTVDSDEHIARALSEGAAGFLVKNTDPAQLPSLVRALAAGGVVLSPQVSRTMVAGFLGKGEHASSRLVETLTDRERDVLVRLAEGASNAAIGAALHLSVGTIKDHVSSLLGKLGVGTRLQAALVAERSGLTRAGGDPDAHASDRSAPSANTRIAVVR